MEYGETQMSVKWLERKIQKEIAMYGSISSKMISILAEHAIAIHKKESQKIFECGRNFQLTGEGTFKQVYNETFGGNNE